MAHGPMPLSAGHRQRASAACRARPARCHADRAGPAIRTDAAAHHVAGGPRGVPRLMGARARAADLQRAASGSATATRRAGDASDALDGEIWATCATAGRATPVAPNGGGCCTISRRFRRPGTWSRRCRARCPLTTRATMATAAGPLHQRVASRAVAGLCGCSGPVRMLRERSRGSGSRPCRGVRSACILFRADGESLRPSGIICCSGARTGGGTSPGLSSAAASPRNCSCKEQRCLQRCQT